MGRAARLLDPLADLIAAHLLGDIKIHGDDTPVPVLRPAPAASGFMSATISKCLLGACQAQILRPRPEPQKPDGPGNPDPHRRPLGHRGRRPRATARPPAPYPAGRSRAPAGRPSRLAGGATPDLSSQVNHGGGDPLRAHPLAGPDPYIDESGRTAATFYTLIETAKLDGREPRASLKQVLDSIARNPSAPDYPGLMPWAIQTAR